MMELIILFALSIFLSIAMAGCFIILIASDEVLHIIGAFLGIIFVVLMLQVIANPACTWIVSTATINAFIVSVRRQVRKY